MSLLGVLRVAWRSHPASAERPEPAVNHRAMLPRSPSSTLRTCALGALTALLAAGCVPATAPRVPRGAVSVKLVPSPASRGEAFQTADGWSVRFTRFSLTAYVSALGVGNESGFFIGGGEAAEVFVPGSVESETTVRAIPVGPVVATIEYTSRTLVRGACPYCPPYETDKSDEAMRRRFGEPIDGAVGECESEVVCGVPTPSVWFVVEAVRGPERVTFDLTTTASLYSEVNRSAPVTVVPNDIVPATLVLTAENLFRLPDGRLGFDDFANADTNRDGVLTYSELLQAKEARFSGYLDAIVAALQRGQEGSEDGSVPSRSPKGFPPGYEGPVADDSEPGAEGVDGGAVAYDLYAVFQARASLVLAQSW